MKVTAKQMVMKPQYKMKVAQDKTKYNRKRSNNFMKQWVLDCPDAEEIVTFDGTIYKYVPYDHVTDKYGKTVKNPYPNVWVKSEDEWEFKQ